MGSLVYFLVLAIVSFTGKAVASSHNARRRRLAETFDNSKSEKIELRVLDEKQATHDSLSLDSLDNVDGVDGASLSDLNLDLPMYRIRRTLLGSGAILEAAAATHGLKEEAKEKEILAQRRRLKKSLRIVIPSGEDLKTKTNARPSVSDVPPTFNLYSDSQHNIITDATSLSLLATSSTRKTRTPQPRLRSVVSVKRDLDLDFFPGWTSNRMGRSSAMKVVGITNPEALEDVGSLDLDLDLDVSEAAVRVANAGAGTGTGARLDVSLREPAIKRVGVLRIGRGG